MNKVGKRVTRTSVNKPIEELSIATVDPSARGKERKAFPGWLYAVLFLVFDFLAIAILQWGVTLSSTRVTLSSPLNGPGDLVSKMWLKLNLGGSAQFVQQGNPARGGAGPPRPGG